MRILPALLSGLLDFSVLDLDFGGGLAGGGIVVGDSDPETFSYYVIILSIRNYFITRVCLGTYQEPSAAP